MDGSVTSVSGSKKVYRKRRSSGERRSKMLGIARAMFLKNGYGGTTMSAVAAAVGGSKATLWVYFRSKEALFAEAVKEGVASLHSQLLAALDNEIDAVGSLRAFAEIFVSKLSSPDAMALHRIIIAEVPSFPELGNIFYTNAVLPVSQRLADFFEREMKARRMRASDPQQAALELISLLQRPQQFLMWNLSYFEDETAKSEYIGNVLDMFLRAYDYNREKDLRVPGQ